MHHQKHSANTCQHKHDKDYAHQTEALGKSAGKLVVQVTFYQYTFRNETTFHAELQYEIYPEEHNYWRDRWEKAGEQEREGNTGRLGKFGASCSRGRGRVTHYQVWVTWMKDPIVTFHVLSNPVIWRKCQCRDIDPNANQITSTTHVFLPEKVHATLHG